MKKKLVGLTLVFTIFFLSACHTRPQEKNSITAETVQKITGTWFADSYDYGTYVITSDNKKIDFNSTHLTIDFTEENTIYTYETDDTKSHYTFKIEEDTVTVYPTYEVEPNAVGGSLAPIILKKQQQISTKNILGSWQSTESDYPAFIQVKATFDPLKIDLLLAKAEGASDREIIPLTLESKKADKSLIYLNSDKSLRYTFSNYENKKLILTSTSTKQDAEGTARPWILTRVH